MSSTHVEVDEILPFPFSTFLFDFVSFFTSFLATALESDKPFGPFVPFFEELRGALLDSLEVGGDIGAADFLDTFVIVATSVKNEQHIESIKN